MSGGVRCPAAVVPVYLVGDEEGAMSTGWDRVYEDMLRPSGPTTPGVVASAARCLAQRVRSAAVEVGEHRILRGQQGHVTGPVEVFGHDAGPLVGLDGQLVVQRRMPALALPPQRHAAGEQRHAGQQPTQPV